MNSVLDAKTHKIQSELNLQRDEQQKFFEISYTRNQAYMHLNQNFEDHKNETVDQIAKFKTDVNQKLVE